MGVLRFIFNNLDHFKTRFFFVFASGILDGFATFMIPVLLAEFTKSDFTQSRFRSLVCLLVLFYLASLMFEWIERRYGESMGPQFGNYIRLKYFKALEKMPLKDLTAHHSGYILSLVNKIADGMAPALNSISWTFSKSIANITLFFYFTARESVAMAIFNVAVLGLFVYVSVFLSKKMVPIAEELNRKRASLIESYADFASNIFTIKKLGVADFAEERLLQKTGENYQQIQKLQDFHSNRWFLLHSLFGATFLSTIGFILFQVSQGKISASALILFIAAYTAIKGNVERLSESFKDLMEMKAYMVSLDDVISFEKVANEGGEEKAAWQEIKFRNVFFQYPNTDKKISIPEFRIKKGEKICIVGKSGEGKTTFLNLFGNFLSPDEGERTVDGLPYEKMNAGFFTKNIAAVSQETELFNLSLRDNVALGKNIEDKTIVNIFDKLDLLPWMGDSEKGLDTVVGEKGTRLSAGQKQRVNLARGILFGREILLLDEPTSHLDGTTEKKVTDFLSCHLADKTAIIVTHRKDLETVCSRRYIVRGHSLVEESD